MLPRLIKKQAEVAGKAMAALWVVRHHLWFSQYRLEQNDQDGLMRLPAESLAMFDQEASEFCVLPFGISLAPHTVARWQQEGLRIPNFLGNWLVCAWGHRHECQEKSRLVPCQFTQFLGMVFNYRTAIASLTLQNQEAFRACLGHFYLGARVTWKLSLRLLGLDGGNDPNGSIGPYGQCRGASSG